MSAATLARTAAVSGRYFRRMILEFIHLGSPGAVSVSVVANTDPGQLGGDEDNRGFPACTATVSYRGGGYLAMMGWVQLVRSTDAETSDFEMDPYFLFPDIDSPYAFYGYQPTLFDSPGRAHRAEMNWVAHSFLAATPLYYKARIVRRLVGFSWGFSIRDGQIELIPAAPLALSAWGAHHAYLHATFPNWQFET
jgi:hypothetical protein